MRNPYMKFQNSSIHGFKVMLCIKKRDERTDGRTTQKQYAPPTSLKLGALLSTFFPYKHMGPIQMHTEANLTSP